jgi:AcrR family transcriptional regulator
LTLEAVAIVAGISKASVIYDYKSKQELVRAVIERRVADEEAALDAEARKLGRRSATRIRAHLARAATEVSDDKRMVAINLCAALANDTELRSIIQQSLKRELGSINDSSENPRSARLAFFAMQGLKFLELLGVHAWSQAERRRILDEIEQLADGRAPNAPDARDTKNAVRAVPEDVA